MRISDTLMETFRDLAELEYAVHQGALSRRDALDSARQKRIPERFLDQLKRGPGTGATTVIRGPRGTQPMQLRIATAANSDAVLAHRDSPINRQLRDMPFHRAHATRPLTQAHVEGLARRFSERLGFPVTVDWGSASTRIDVDVEKGTTIEIPGGLARHPGMTEDALALIVAHEYGHIHLRSSDEAAVDYWAARHGLPILWAGEDNQLERAVLAAYSTLLFLAQNTTEPLQLICGDREPVYVHLSGYPTLQSRWQLFKSGIFGLPCPEIVHPRLCSEPRMRASLVDDAHSSPDPSAPPRGV